MVDLYGLVHRLLLLRGPVDHTELYVCIDISADLSQNTKICTHKH